jgi:uncharacterized protein
MGSTRIAYADLADDPLVSAMGDCAWHPADAGAATRLARELFTLQEPVPAAVARRVLASTGPFATLARRTASVDPGRLGRAREELAVLGRLAHVDLRGMLAGHGLSGAVPDGAVEGRGEPPAVLALLRHLAADPEWGPFAGRIAALHHAEGTGPLLMHRVLRFTGEALEGVDHPDPLGLEDLIGGDERREPLRTALTAFARGAPPVDALLYGAPGTGKSATVRALAASLAGEGLRLVQVDRDRVGAVGRLFALVAGAGPRCLVLLDDLVFDEAARTDRALRAALEGDVAARPANVAVWATSNRMRLLHETLSGREDDVEAALGRGERSALATRFGLRVGFTSVPPAEYLRTALGLARRHLGDRLPDDAEEQALRWARERGLTPRAARQFADHLAAIAPAAAADRREAGDG